MIKPIPVSKPIHNLLPTDVAGFDSLTELALDMRWSWNHAADEVWRQLDPVLRELAIILGMSLNAVQILWQPR